jgi:prevent-host-death family protein
VCRLLIDLEFAPGDPMRMKATISVTEVVRRFDELLDEIKRTGDTVEITRNGEPVATLAPVRGGPGMTLRQFASLWKTPPNNPTFANVLEQINEADLPTSGPSQ